MKRILSLDGGGSRGLFTIQVLKKIERSLPIDPATGVRFELNTYFDLMAGTSTGSIIVTLLRWGFSLEEIENFYFDKLPLIFDKGFRIPALNHVFKADNLKKELQRIFGVPQNFSSENLKQAYWRPGEPLPESSYGSSKLKGYLMIVVMRADTLSHWIQTNHPDAPYNDTQRFDCNLQIPIWQLIRASTAAPYYFPPQKVWFPNKDGKSKIGRNGRRSYGKFFYFVDGGISGYNNPAHLAYRMATLPEYHFGWKSGKDHLKIISVGTGDYDSHAWRPRPDRPWKIAAKSATESSLTSLMALSSLEQDMQCRIVGDTLEGHWIDRGVGDIRFADPRRDQFTYCRYQKPFLGDELETLIKNKVDTRFTSIHPDSLRFFVEEGQKYAEEFVKEEHFL